ncbi:diguanylate cyclase domain-containing protein, partial [Achromobacter ruhlandii]|uniref:diguanylate cyclase domain-containing protein n=1 Tax=Achromobacter ruhlandii TaxID=72557 RepID=UPI003558A1F3
QVNDTLGHPIGDALLRDIAQRLRRLARATDIVGRLSGDEFVMPMLTDGLSVMPPTTNGCDSDTRMCSAAAVRRPCSKSGISIT